METIKTNSQTEDFVKKVESLKKEMLGENDGFVLLTYSEIDNANQQNSFAVSGKLNRIAECFVSFMKSEPTMANVILAAGSAIVQNRIVEAQILAEAKKTKKNKKKN